VQVICGYRFTDKNPCTSGPEVLFKTCVAMKFVDDYDDEVRKYSNVTWVLEIFQGLREKILQYFIPKKSLLLDLAYKHGLNTVG